MKSTIGILSVAFCLFAQPSLAQQYQIVPNANSGTGVALVIPYDLGTHHGSALQIAGGLVISENFASITGGFTVPIDSLNTGNPTRDCHMRESLGLDYSKSHFPKAHVCDSKNQLPSAGVDAAAFQTIEFKLLNVTGEVASQMKAGNTFTVTANGTWSVHGIEKSLSFAMKVIVLANGILNIKGSVPFAISDYGIIVKPLLGIGVKNNMSADLDIFLAPKK